MGRRTELIQFYEVKMRSNGDRVTSDGHKVEGGAIFSRHFEANSPRHAKIRAQGQGKIISIRKVKKEDVLGSIDSMNLSSIIGRPVKERRFDAIVENVGLEELVFGKRKRPQ